MMDDTIAAISTPLGQAGIGIIRLSGEKTKEITTYILKKELKPRYADYLPFYDQHSKLIDQGIAIFFQKPHSFTGEDVLELHAHGGPIVLDTLMKTIIQLGARIAKPGEFSERAFLNNKLDLSQAEAIADLINASSEQAARCAIRSLQGEFSKKIHELVALLTELRIHIEAAIDFPDEEIDFLSDGVIKKKLTHIQSQLNNVMAETRQGTILQEGMTIVIAGRPNAGKSSLLNQLSGRESAIVTDIPGTTRDILREYIHIDGIPLHIIDTAGLRDSDEIVEQEGIRRAWDAIQNADRILLVIDSQEDKDNNPEHLWPEFMSKLPQEKAITIIRNKADLSNEKCESIQFQQHTIISLSAKTGEGIDLLREHLKQCIGFDNTAEGGFIARRRHLDALERSNEYLHHAETQLNVYRAGELVAEDLRQAQLALGEITGDVHSDDLLGEIFNNFCIGK